MGIPESFFNPLAIIHSRLADLSHPWAITGSLGMVLQGMDLEVHDIDLQSNTAGTLAMAQALEEFVIHPITMRSSESIRSLFGTLEIAGVKVEIMGNMQHLQPDGAWSDAPEMAPLVRWAEYRGQRFPVMDLHHEVEAYRQMSRFARVDAIQRFIAGEKA